MATQQAPTGSILLTSLGDFRWVRAHVSFYAVGAVLLVGANLLIGGSRLWSLTAIGIWSMLLIVHLLLLAIARLSTQLLADDDEEVVLLPMKDAVIVDPKPDPTASWVNVEAADTAGDASAESSETVSWQVATDVAQARPHENDTEAETS